MQVIRDLRELPKSHRPCAVTIGNFDGVHLAHQQLLRAVVAAARAGGATAAAVTFEPHPAKILRPDHAPKLLIPLDRKIRFIEEQGIDTLVVLPFTDELAKLSPAAFVRNVLVEGLRATSAHVGSNFHFGHRQAGGAQTLAALARENSFDLTIVPILKVRGEPVSSTRIREFLDEGRVHLAGRLLGRPFSVCGLVVRGLGVGKTKTVPTLNLAPVDLQLPAIGVYVTRTTLGNTAYESVSNVGHKPTFGQHRLTVESFLLNFSGTAREPEMEVEFLHRLRDEIKFPSPTALKAQIQRDAGRSVKFFRLLKLLQSRRSELLPSGNRRRR